MLIKFLLKIKQCLTININCKLNILQFYIILKETRNYYKSFFSKLLQVINKI